MQLPTRCLVIISHYLERVASLNVYHCFPGGPSDQILDSFGQVLDAGGKPDKNLQKQVSTGNHMHMSAGTRDRTWDSLVQNE